MKTILAIATNDQTVLKGKKTGLWLAELTHFLDAVTERGYAYDLASPKGGKVPLDEKSVEGGSSRDPVDARFLQDPEFLRKLEGSLPVSDISAEKYVAVYLAGGHGTMFDFRTSMPLQQLLADFYEQGRPISGVCHGVCALIDVVDETGKPLIAGRSITGFSNLEDTLAGMKKLMPFLLEDALKESGAAYRKNLVPFTSRVEVDGPFITGQNPASARDVALTLLKQLEAASPRA